MKSECKAAMKRASIPDCSAGPMSRAMEDRRILTAEIESLQAEVKGLRSEVAFWLCEGQQERPEVIELQTLVKLSSLSKTQLARVRELNNMFHLEHEDHPVLLAKIKSLQAVVKQLPKTADGVPVAPGMKVFYRHAVGGTIYSDVIADLTPYSTDPESSIWAGGEIGVDQCYSTEAAARAAGEEGSDDGH